MQYILTEEEYSQHRDMAADFKQEKQQLIGELAEAKGVAGCPAIGNERSAYPCYKCPMLERCVYQEKYAYLPK